MREEKRSALPKIGTEFRINERIYIVIHTGDNRFFAAPKETGRIETEPAAAFNSEDWDDEYCDGLQLLDPEPEEWGWRKVK